MSNRPPLARSLAALAPLAVAVAGLALLASTQAPVAAQRRRAPALPFEGTTVEWTLFVSPHGESPSQRSVIGATSASVPLEGTSYACSYGAPNRVAIDAQHWSETRNLECTFGTTHVSTSGFCQVSEGTWGPRAAVLYLAEEGATERIQVTLDCAVRAATPSPR